MATENNITEHHAVSSTASEFYRIHRRLSEAHASLDLLHALFTSADREILIEALDSETLTVAVDGAKSRIQEAMSRVDEQDAAQAVRT